MGHTGVLQLILEKAAKTVIVLYSKQSTDKKWKRNMLIINNQSVTHRISGIGLHLSSDCTALIVCLSV